uniref:Uncharacterized protein n=1 Tax=Mycena chlorophos TaxID=658473 RepID=A0ABQ0M2B3_MYCCL|nr:predicted protein [Mycena chlorophos]
MPRAFFAVFQPAAPGIANLEKPDAAHWHGHDLQLPGWNMKSLPDLEALPTRTFVPYTGTGVEHRPSAHSEPRHRRRRRLEYALFTSLSLLYCVFVLQWMSTVGVGATGEDPRAAPAPPIRVADASLVTVQGLETSMMLELVGIGGFIGTALFVLRHRDKRDSEEHDPESALTGRLEQSEGGKSGS